MSIDLASETHLYLPKDWPRHRRFVVKIPMDFRYYPGAAPMYITVHVIATNARQARAHARAEVLKMTRQNVNRAEVIDTQPEEKKDDRRRF